MNIQLLKELCALYGPSGFEKDVAEFIRKDIGGYADDCETDRLGSLIAHKKGPGKKMMLAGHMDQLGLMVTGISKEGFLYFAPLGGNPPPNLLTQRVVFKNGVSGAVNCERLEDKEKMTLEKLYVDIGAKDEEDAKRSVSVGDVCVFYAPPLVNGNIIISPALDDRVGCFIMMEAIKKVKKPVFDLFFVFTAQEELGLRGARTSAYSINPDYAISFDVTGSYDTPKARKLPSKMYKGAAIKLKDSSLICHPLIIKHMERRAAEAGINHQLEILEGGGTDSGAIHISRSGVPSGVLSVPTRYVHSASEMCALSDVEDCVSLTVRMLETEIG